MKECTHWGFYCVTVGRINRFSYNEMYWHFAWTKNVAVLTKCPYDGVPLYLNSCFVTKAYC